MTLGPRTVIIIITYLVIYDYILHTEASDIIHDNSGVFTGGDMGDISPPKAFFLTNSINLLSFMLLLLIH